QYDAIVIGGGPAGSVITKLLSDDSWRRVLLIEAGDASQHALGGTDAIDSPLNSGNLTAFDVPYFWTRVANTPELHWDYPDVNVAKALGGCGIHNGMLYVRAIPEDLSNWAMKSWTWEKAMQLYVNMEDYNGPDEAYHGKGGIVRTSMPAVQDDVSEKFIEACVSVGLPRSPDFNAPGGRYGAGYYHFNTRNGVRDSAARTFLGPLLQPGQERANLKLMLNTKVAKIDLNQAGTAATGVTIHREDDNSTRTVRLAKHGQVILTAGAINTPKVLLLSGIGDPHDLSVLGIPTKRVNSRVGVNLQDHPVLGMTFKSLSQSPINIDDDLARYFKARENEDENPTSYGRMGSSGISVGAFLIPPGSTIPGIQLTFFPQKSEPHLSNSRELNHTSEVLVTVALLTPEARNRVVLTSSDHHASPRVVPEVPEGNTEHLSGSDVWKLSWGVRVVREIMADSSLADVVGPELTPGPAVVTDEDLNKWIYGAVFRNSHWVGSASMGHSERNGVVDHRLRVFGIPNLRVADASVIPVIPNGNVHSSVLMVASHAAQLIKEDEQPEFKEE
ncbi:TPA: hypothetical protein N0F65_005270, partial [Lagenidium giganteum]